MQTIGEKIKYLIAQAGFKKPGAFYNQMLAHQGPDVMDRKTFYNLLHDRVPPRESTLFQIALVLNMTTTELRQGTNQETTLSPREDRIYSGKHTYNEGAFLYGYHVKAPFMPLRLHLKAGGRTPEDRDSKDAQQSLKLIWVIVGKITIVIKTNDGEERRELHNGQITTFDARQTHYFINASKSNSVAHIIHYPAENNGFYVP